MGEVIEKARYSLKGVEIRYIHLKDSVRFRSVGVITSATHAEGRRFEPGRKHFSLPNLLLRYG